MTPSERKPTNGNVQNGGAFRDPAVMENRDAPVHRWVPWVAGYSKYFVEDAITSYTSGPSVVLDPFAGVGTTLVEADLGVCAAGQFRNVRERETIAEELLKGVLWSRFGVDRVSSHLWVPGIGG